MKINYRLIFITSAVIVASTAIVNSINNNTKNKITDFIKKIRENLTGACETNQKNPNPQISRYNDESPVLQFDTDSNPVNSENGESCLLINDDTNFSHVNPEPVSIPIQQQQNRILPIALIEELEEPSPENSIS